MTKARSITKSPTLLTAILSVAALAGYASWRLMLGFGPDGPESTLPDALPEIAINDLAGTPTPLSSFTGQPLLINFWATWCGPCLREIPLLKAFREENPSIEILGIAVDTPEAVQGYAGEMQFNYPLLVGRIEGANAMTALGNDAAVMPFSVFTAADGAVLGIYPGELHAEHLETLSAVLTELEAGEISRRRARARLEQLRPH